MCYNAYFFHRDIFSLKGNEGTDWELRICWEPKQRMSCIAHIIIVWERRKWFVIENGCKIVAFTRRMSFGHHPETRRNQNHLMNFSLSGRWCVCQKPSAWPVSWATTYSCNTVSVLSVAIPRVSTLPHTVSHCIITILSISYSSASGVDVFNYVPVLFLIYRKPNQQ